MQEGSTPVRSGGKVVGTATFPIFETVEEAVADQGESIILGFINAQIKQTNAQRLRAAVTGKPSKLDLQMQAFQAIPPEEIAAHAGDKAWLVNRIAEETAILKKQYEDAAAEPVETPIDDNNDEDLD